MGVLLCISIFSKFNGNSQNEVTIAYKVMSGSQQQWYLMSTRESSTSHHHLTLNLMFQSKTGQTINENVELVEFWISRRTTTTKKYKSQKYLQRGECVDEKWINLVIISFGRMRTFNSVNGSENIIKSNREFYFFFILYSIYFSWRYFEMQRHLAILTKRFCYLVFVCVMDDYG